MPFGSPRRQWHGSISLRVAPKLTATVPPGRHHPDKVEASGGNREEAMGKFREMQESYEVLADEKAKAKYDALWEGQHSALAKAERENDVAQAAQRQAARDSFARGQHAARAAQEKATRLQRERAAQRKAAREKEEESCAQQEAAFEKEETDRREQYKARAQRAARERGEREQAVKDRAERRNAELLFLLAREKEAQAAQMREQLEHAMRFRASRDTRDQVRGREQEPHLSTTFAKAVEKAAWIWEHQKDGARKQGPFADHFTWEQRGLTDRDQATRETEARSKEAREEQAAMGRWASREPGAWERTDQTRGRAAWDWARVQSSLEKIVREKVEHARGRVAREQRKRARVPAGLERKHGFSAEPVPGSAYVGSSKNLKDLQENVVREQLRRPWTDVGFRRVLEPLPQKLGNRQSSI